MSSFFLHCISPYSFFFFFFNDTATTEIYTLSLHDALPICSGNNSQVTSANSSNNSSNNNNSSSNSSSNGSSNNPTRSEEHTSELQSPDHLVCRLLLEKKKKQSTEVHQKCNSSAQRCKSLLF